MTGATQICHAIELISTYNKEIKSLIEETRIRITTELSKATTSIKLGEWSPLKTDKEESNTIDISFLSGLPLQGSRRKSPDRYLYIQVSTQGSHIGQPYNHEPLLHVCLWTTPANFKKGGYFSWPLEAPPRSINKNLLLWDMEHSDIFGDCEWTFSVKLLSVNCDNDIDKYIVTPIIKLIEAGDDIKKHQVKLDSEIYFSYSDEKIKNFQELNNEKDEGLS